MAARTTTTSRSAAPAEARRPWAASANLHAWWSRHPDLGRLSVVLAVGLVLRLALLYRIPPLFMPGDSQSFLTPAYDLARGLGFDPILKRPLGYPLFIAATILALSEDPRALIFVQAMLGLATVAVTYWIGRLAFGRAAGLLAALLVAIGGQLLIYEHYILAESVFALLLALAVLGTMAAVGHGARAALLGGVALAGASLFRPIAEVLIPVLPAFFLLVARPSRRALTLSAFAGLGFLGLMLPAVTVDATLRGGFSSGAVGEHLLWRITRSDAEYISRDDVPRAEPDSPHAVAKRLVIRRAADRRLPQEIYTELHSDLGLGASEADGVMREVALEAIGRQWQRYVTSTLAMSIQLFLGADQPLGEVSKRDGEARYANPQTRQRSWFEDRVLHLGEPPSLAVQNEFDEAAWLTGLFQPGQFGIVWPALILLGGGLAAFGRPSRLGLLLVLALPPLLLANAAFAGPEARFRYPLDPLFGVLASGAAMTVLVLAVDAVRKRGAGAEVRAHRSPAAGPAAEPAANLAGDR
ncbi:MAG: glycosyltransferase family 39 protein [Chloroflexi bacterium]|nr:glycosyltransferase family 39 protein [Chloroflexota bacterium]